MHFFGDSNTDRSAILAEVDRLEALAAALEVLGLSPLPPEWFLAKMESSAPILENWKFAIRPAFCLSGLVTGHPALAGERRSIITSELWLFSKSLRWARSYNRFYRLGEPCDTASWDCRNEIARDAVNN